MNYGPYEDGDLVYTVVNNGIGGGILYGKVFRAGKKTFSIMWEAEYVSRYEQTYHMSRADFKVEGADYKMQIDAALTALIAKREKRAQAKI